MGVFGFLSKAHTDQSLVSGDVIAKISIYDEKIKQSRDNIDMARRALQQMDTAVDQTMSRSTTESGADKAAQLRRGQANERNRLLKEIDTEQKKIQALNEQRAPIAAEVRKVEAEVGPIKYIAALIYGDNPEANVLEKSVRWVIILIVVVFDPLALTLLLAATKSIEWERGINLLQPVGRKSDDKSDDDLLTDEQLDQINAQLKEAQEDPEVTEFFDRARETAKKLDNGTYVPPYMFVANQSEESSQLSDTTILESAERKIPPQNRVEARELYNNQLQAQADNMPESNAGEVKGFGSQFPTQASKGDMFLRVDSLPSKLYKFNGTNWIEIDKTLSDNHAYDDAYIDHLIDKLASGEYDEDLLSDAERDRILRRLDNSSQA
jgi:hypothetical protein